MRVVRRLLEVGRRGKIPSHTPHEWMSAGKEERGGKATTSASSLAAEEQLLLKSPPSSPILASVRTHLLRVRFSYAN